MNIRNLIATVVVISVFGCAQPSTIEQPDPSSEPVVVKTTIDFDEISEFDRSRKIRTRRIDLNPTEPREFGVSVAFLWNSNQAANSITTFFVIASDSKAAHPFIGIRNARFRVNGGDIVSHRAAVKPVTSRGAYDRARRLVPTVTTTAFVLPIEFFRSVAAADTVLMELQGDPGDILFRLNRGDSFFESAQAILARLDSD